MHYNEQRVEEQLEFIQAEPQASRSEAAAPEGDLLSPSRGLLLAIGLGIAFWSVLGLLAYLFAMIF